MPVPTGSRAGKQDHSLPNYFSFGNAGPASVRAMPPSRKQEHSLPTNTLVSVVPVHVPRALSYPPTNHTHRPTDPPPTARDRFASSVGPLPRSSHSTELVLGGQKALTLTRASVLFSSLTECLCERIYFYFMFGCVDTSVHIDSVTPQSPSTSQMAMVLVVYSAA